MFEKVITKKLLTESEYDKIHNDYKGVWSTERDDIPNWDEMRTHYMGKRSCMMLDNGGTCSVVEGIGLKIVADKDINKYAWLNSRSLQQDIIDLIGERMTGTNEEVRNAMQKTAAIAIIDSDLNRAYSAYKIFQEVSGKKPVEEDLFVSALSGDSASSTLRHFVGGDSYEAGSDCESLSPC